MKVKILLEGYLRPLYPDGVTVFAETLREALGLLTTYVGFRTEDKVRHYVKVDILTCYSQMDAPLVSDTVTITPILGGAGGGSGRQILIGALLIGLSFAMPMFVGPANAAFGSALSGGWGIAQTMIFNVGVSLVIGGLMQHMARSPKADPTSGDKRSRFISGTANTVAAGTGIPLIYGGPIKVGGHFLSFDIDAEDYVPE